MSDIRIHGETVYVKATVIREGVTTYTNRTCTIHLTPGCMDQGIIHYRGEVQGVYKDRSGYWCKNGVKLP